MDLFCPVLRTPFIGSMMKLFGYFGHGSVGGIVGLSLLGHSYYYKNERSKWAGLAVLAAFFVAAGIAEILNHLVPLTRPKLPLSYGPPSGRTSAAFGMAAALSFTFPGLSPLFFGLAILTGISRLYLRAQNTWNVIGGVILGLACGIPIAQYLVPRAKDLRQGSLVLVGWLCVLPLGVGALAYFYSAESNIAVHLATTIKDSPKRPAAANFDFGAPDARPSLRFGWSGDELWNGGKQSVVWASGLASEFVLNLPAEQDYHFRVNAFPYSPAGHACQRIEVRINEMPVAKVSLAQGWHWYQFDVPKSAVRVGRNFIQFYYDYAEAPKSRGRNSDERRLSVAFDSLQVLP